MSDDDLKALFAETYRQIDEKAAETQRHVDAKAAETQRHFDEKTETLSIRFEDVVESMEKRFDGLAEAVQSVGRRLDRETADIRAEMKQGFNETHVLIKYSYGELDRRVTALENNQPPRRTGR